MTLKEKVEILLDYHLGESFKEGIRKMDTEGKFTMSTVRKLLVLVLEELDELQPILDEEYVKPETPIQPIKR